MQEAQTKNGWKVWGPSAGSKAVDFKQLYVNRDLRQDLVDRWVQAYRGMLKPHLQAAFLRRFAYVNSHS